MPFQFDGNTHSWVKVEEPSNSTAGLYTSNKNPWDPSQDYKFGDLLGGLMYNISGTRAQNDYNAAEAEKARIYNEEQAKAQREWEERMASSTYQRTVADMKAAGINPAILSGLTSGSATSIGSGSAASASSASSSSGTSNGIIGALALVIAALTRGKVKAK